MNSKGQSAATAELSQYSLGLLALLLFDKSCRNLSRGRFQRYCRKPRLSAIVQTRTVCSIHTRAACCAKIGRHSPLQCPFKLAFCVSPYTESEQTYTYFSAWALAIGHLSLVFFSRLFATYRDAKHKDLSIFIYYICIKLFCVGRRNKKKNVLLCNISRYFFFFF